MIRLLFICLFCASVNSTIFAQCFASAGNPVGGTANMGVMDKNVLRLAVFERYAYAGKYKSGWKKYSGSRAIVKQANYNYTGWLAGYGISDKLTLEAEGGYFWNKTQEYVIDDYILSGWGLSNSTISIKPLIYNNLDERFEVSCAFGAIVPFSRKPQFVNRVELPIDIQPSTGSYGIVYQSFMVKEDSFNARRYFWINRIEKYYPNTQNFTFGTLYSSSLYYSRHYIFDKWKLKDWTVIMQIKGQYKERNIRNNTTIVAASGSAMLIAVPQLNLSIAEKWNISILGEIPVLQYYNGEQLANSYSFSLSLVRDFSLSK